MLFLLADFKCLKLGMFMCNYVDMDEVKVGELMT